MKLELSKEEHQLLIMAIEAAVKHASNSLQAASVFLPLVVKLQDAAAVEEAPPKTPPKFPKPPKPTKPQDNKDS